MVLGFLKSSFQAVKSALKKTRDRISNHLRDLFSRPVDDELLEELERTFYEADLGVKTSQELAEKTKRFMQENEASDAESILSYIEGEVISLLDGYDHSIKENSIAPTVILVVGVNGNGKTTFVAKLAKKLVSEGKQVIVAAADTFRAGAQEQLAVWAKRLSIDIISGSYGSDPAAVAFDAYQAAKSRKADYLIIDTAGRLENKTHLMKELEKVRRSLQKIGAGAPHETLLVLDATVGQNGLHNAKAFSSFTPLTGVVLTKMDGTAKGGGAVAIQNELRVPIKFIGTGEGMDDLAPFDVKSFAHALFFS